MEKKKKKSMQSFFKKSLSRNSVQAFLVLSEKESSEFFWVRGENGNFSQFTFFIWIIREISDKSKGSEMW